MSTELVFTILDDYHVLETAELVEKHRELWAETHVREALAALDGLQSRGILLDHSPSLPFPGHRVLHEGAEISYIDFLANQRSQLILELTQECNQRCKYCCYGEHFSDFRRTQLTRPCRSKPRPSQ